MTSRHFDQVARLKADLNGIIERAGRQLQELDKLVGRPSTRRPLVALIQGVICEHYGCHIITMTTRDRHVRSVEPRQMAMYFCRHATKYSLQELAAAFHRDHGTIIHAVRTVAARAATESAYRENFEAVQAKVLAALAAHKSKGIAKAA